MSGASKANQRQSRKNAGYYAAQFDKTKINKIITNARHIERFTDTRSADRLKQKPKIDLHYAAIKAKSLGMVRVAIMLQSWSK